MPMAIGWCSFTEGNRMMSAVKKTLGTIVEIIAAPAVLVVLAVLFAVPFIAVGIGIGSMAWTFCLFVNFC